MDPLPTLLIAAGVVVIVFALMRGRGAGRMPGDISASRGPVRFYAPLGTSLLLSILLTIVLNLVICGGPRI